MARYTCRSLTGYGIAPEGQRSAGIPRRWGTGAGPHDPITTWYVFDSAFCDWVVFETPYEDVAKEKVFRLNAADRRWDHEEMAARNGSG